MKPLFVVPLQLLCEKRFGKKWKPFIAAVHSASPFGRARIELYSNEKKFKNGEPHKVILLDNCICMRTFDNEKNAPHVLRLTMNDNSLISLAADDIFKLKEVVSHAAFPTKMVTIQPSSSSTDSMDDNQANNDAFEEFPLIKKVPVLFLSTTLSRSKKLVEGNYDLDFEDCLILKLGDSMIDAWDYANIIWVATGEHCCGFEVEDVGVLEFKCAEPSLVMDNFRRHVRFSTIFTPISKRTKNAYNRTYNALKTQPKMTDTTIEETEEEVHMPPASDSRYSTVCTKDSGISDVHASSSFSHPVMISKSMMSLSDSVTTSSDHKEKKDGNKFFAFLRRNSSKRKDKDAPQRDDFEENASCEWTRVSPQPPAIEVNSLIENAWKFKEELTAIIEKRRMKQSQQELNADRTSFCDELERHFGHLSAKERTSVACSEPATRYQ